MCSRRLFAAICGPKNSLCSTACRSRRPIFWTPAGTAGAIIHRCRSASTGPMPPRIYAAPAANVTDPPWPIRRRRLIMKTLLSATIALFIGAGCPGASVPATSVPAAKITGDYVEARTASVFAGACHYNGELVTTGRDAILAWSFTSGLCNGADLTGLRAMAAVTCDQSLGYDHAARKTE